MPDFMTAPCTAYFLVFARLGSMLMVMPALGDENVPSRVRLLFALTLSLVVLPVVLVSLPPMPRTLPAILSDGPSAFPAPRAQTETP